jgi:hypothetical protein
MSLATKLESTVVPAVAMSSSKLFAAKSKTDVLLANPKSEGGSKLLAAKSETDVLPAGSKSESGSRRLDADPCELDDWRRLESSSFLI